MRNLGDPGRFLQFSWNGCGQIESEVVSIESVTARCKIDESVSFETGLNCQSYCNNRGDERHPPATASELVAFESGRYPAMAYHLRGNAYSVTST